jgi:hypothetical protein
MNLRSRRLLLISHLCLPAMLGLGATWLAAAPPAMACGSVAPGTSEAVDRSFSFKNGLRLGAEESTVLKTFGQPQERFGTGHRCGDSQISFVYGLETVVVLDRTAPYVPGGKIRYVPPQDPQRLNPANEPLDHSAIATSRVIVQLSTQNPDLKLSSNIHVGDSLDQVIEVYGQPESQSRQSDLTLISYQQGNEVLRFKLKDDRIHTVELMLNNHDRLRNYAAQRQRQAKPGNLTANNASPKPKPQPTSPQP